MPTALHRDALTRFGQAISDPIRVEILLQLRDAHSYPSDLAEQIGVSKQTLSNHLACLRGCGLVVAHAEGRRNRYTIADRRIIHALNDLSGLALAVDPTCRCQDADSGGCC